MTIAMTANEARSTQGRTAVKRRARIVPARHATPRPVGSARRKAVFFRRRAALALILAIATLGIGLWATRADATGMPQPQQVRVVTVAPGESLWHYATEVATPKDNVRDVVETIKKMNQLSDSRLRAGQALTVPVGAQEGGR